MMTTRKPLIERRVQSVPLRTPSCRKRNPLPWIIAILILLTLLIVRHFDRLASERKAKELQAKIDSSMSMQSALADLLERTRNGATDVELARQRDRYRFLLNSAQEWKLNVSTFRTRLIAAGKIAADHGWDKKEVDGFLTMVPNTTTLPNGVEASLLSVDRTSPATTIMFRLLDKRGQPITGLGRQDVSVRRGDRELRHFDVAEAPTSVSDHSIAIVVDCSGSMKGERMQAAKFAIRELKATCGPNTRSMLIAFASEARRCSPLTTDWQLIESQIDKLNADGATALYPAIFTAASDLAACAGAKSIVVVTDGQDTIGSVSLDQVIAACRATNIAVHIVGFAATELDQSSLRRIANETKGGLHFASTPKSCSDALREITRRLSVPAYRIVLLDSADLNEPCDITIGGTDGHTIHVGAGIATRVAQLGNNP